MPIQQTVCSYLRGNVSRKRQGIAVILLRSADDRYGQLLLVIERKDKTARVDDLLRDPVIRAGFR